MQQQHVAQPMRAVSEVELGGVGNTRRDTSSFIVISSSLQLNHRILLFHTLDQQL